MFRGPFCFVEQSVWVGELTACARPYGTEVPGAHLGQSYTERPVRV